MTFCGQDEVLHMALMLVVAFSRRVIGTQTCFPSHQWLSWWKCHSSSLPLTIMHRSRSSECQGKNSQMEWLVSAAFTWEINRKMLKPVIGVLWTIAISEQSPYDALRLVVCLCRDNNMARVLSMAPLLTMAGKSYVEQACFSLTLTGKKECKCLD